MTTASTIADRLLQHTATVTPGLPFHLDRRVAHNEGVSQGDLGIRVFDGPIPSDYSQLENPTDADRQLVPLDGGPGSHHRLASLDGVTIYRPPNWGAEGNLNGPIVVCAKPTSIVHEPGTEHPHGTVFVDEPMTIRCTYQRSLDVDERARRSID